MNPTNIESEKYKLVQLEEISLLPQAIRCGLEVRYVLNHFSVDAFVDLVELHIKRMVRLFTHLYKTKEDMSLFSINITKNDVGAKKY